MSDNKKRKRANDDEAPPSKKISAEAPTSAATVKFSVVKDVGDWAPVISKLRSSALPSIAKKYIYSVST